MKSPSSSTIRTSTHASAKPRWRIATVATVVVGLQLFAGTSQGATLNFETSQSQSMWGSGSAAILDYSQFVGTSWDTPTAHLGGIAGEVVTTPSVPPILITPAIPAQLITPAIPSKVIVPAKKVCVFGACVTTPAVRTPAIPAVYSPAIPAIYSPAIPGVTIDTRTGAKIDASTEGTVGLQQTVKADAGSVNAKLVFDASLQAPEQVAALNLFTLNGAANLQGDSLFSTNFPQLSAKTELVIGAKADVGAQLCVIGPGCLQGATTLGFNPQTIEIIAFNDNNDGRISVLGLDNLGPADFNFGEPIGITGPTGANLGSVTLHVPNLTTEGALAGDALRAAGAADFLELKADLDGIAQTAAGLPPILGAGVDVQIVPGLSLDFSYDLLNVEFGPTFEVLQTFELKPTLMVDLNFSEAVFVEGHDDKITQLTAPVTDLPRIALDVAQTVEVSPTYWVDASFRNITQLGVDGEFVLEAFKASFGLTGLGLTFDLGQLGPMFEVRERFDIADFPPLFDKTFALGGFTPVTGAPFSLTTAAADPQAEEPVLADAVAVLITGSPVELAQEVGRPDTASFEFSFDYLFATDFGILQVWLGQELLAEIASSGVMDDFMTYTLTLLRDTYFGGPGDTSLLRFLLDGPEGATLLLDNVIFPGIVNGDFDIGSLTGRPTGWTASTSTPNGLVGVATFSVPEPGELLLVLTGLWLLALLGRRRHA